MVNKILASAKIMAVLKGKKQNKVEWEDSVSPNAIDFDKQEFIVFSYLNYEHHFHNWSG